MVDTRAALPYWDGAQQARAAEALDDIRAGLAQSVVADDFPAGAFFWVKQVQRYLDLKNPIELPERLELIRLLFEMFAAGKIDPGFQTTVATLLTRLAKKRDKLKGSGLELDWRPFHQTIERMYFAPNRSRVWIDELKHANTLFIFLQHARKYFSPSATLEMLDQFRPQLVPVTDKLYAAQGYLVRMLPVHDADQVMQWLPELMECWNLIQNLPNWDMQWMSLMSEAAKENVGKIDWAPYLAHVYCKGLAQFELPVGSVKIAPLPKSDFDEQFRVFMKINKEHSQLFARFIAFTVHAEGGSLTHLRRMLQAIESFLHPSNSGKWTHPLVRFLELLTRQIAHRIRIENRPDCTTDPALRLTPELQRKLVGELLPLVFLSMFSKSGAATMSANQALKNLAFIAPSIVFPQFLERVGPALDSVTESHRTLSVISALGTLGREMFNRRRFSDGALQLAGLLDLTLPGIDMNDPMKTFASLTFVTNTAYAVTFGNALRARERWTGPKPDWSDEDHTLAAMTAEPTENWLMAYLGRIFQMFENFPEDNGKTAKMSIESGLTQMISHTNDTLFDALLPDYYELALDRVVRFVSTSIFPSARKAVANLVRTCTSTYPAVGLKKLLPVLCTRIADEVEGGAGADTAAAEESERALTWFQTLAYFAVKSGGRELLAHKDLIVATLRHTLPLPRRRANKLAGKLLRHSLRALLNMYPLESRSVAPDVWESRDFAMNHFKHWGVNGDPEKLNLRWHIPAADEIAFAVELIRQFVVPEVGRLEELLRLDPKQTAPAAIFSALTVVRNGLVGMGNLVAPLDDEGEDASPSMPGDDARMDVDQTIDGEMGLRQTRFRYLPSGYCVENKDDALFVEMCALRRRIAAALHALVKHCANLREDDNKTNMLLVKVISIFLCHRGYSHKKATQAAKGFQYVKNMLHDPTVKTKAHARQIIVYRVWALHMTRVAANAIRLNPTRQERALLHDLLALALYNSYAKVRTKAQGRLQGALQCYPNQKYGLLHEAIEAILSPEHYVTKGALFTVRLGPFLTTCSRLWRFQTKLAVTLCQAQHDQKQSTQDILRKVMQDFIVRFQTLTIESSKYEHIRRSATAILVKLGSNPMAGPAGRRTKPAVDNRQLYHDTMTQLLELLHSGKLHWRFEMMAAEFVSMFLRPDASRDLALDWFYQSIAADLPAASEVAIKTTTMALYMQKRPVKEQDDTAMDAGAGLHRIAMPTGFEHATIDLARTKNTIATADDMPAKLYVDDPAVGFMYWPVKYDAYVPGVARPAESTGFHIERLGELVATDAFWDKLVTKMAQERGQEGSSSSFNTLYVDLIKSFARHFGPVVLERIKAPFERICAKPGEKTTQRAAGELLAGLMRGSKQWSEEHIDAMAMYFKPWLTVLFENATPDMRKDWEIALFDSLSNRDPRRSKWLLDFIFSFPVAPEHAYSYDEARKLTFRRAVYDVLHWRLTKHAVVEPRTLEPLLAHPYKQMRDEVGLLVLQLLIVTWHPLLYGPHAHHPPEVEQLMAHMVQQLAAERDVAKTVSAEEALASPTAYTRLSKTVLVSVFHGVSSVAPVMVPHLPRLLPHLFQMLEESDQDLQTMAKTVLLSIPQLVMTQAQVTEVLTQLVHISRSTSWHVRFRVLPTLQVFVFANIFHFDEGMINKTLDMIMAMLEDAQVEIRELAAKTLSGVIRCASRSAVLRLKDHFSRLLATKLAKTKPDADVLLKRHVGVLGLSALVLTFPYDVPAWMPEVLETLARHVNDPAPVQTTVKQTMAEFRRTHQETWHIDRDKFTDDQLSALTDLLVSPSYYA